MEMQELERRVALLEKEVAELKEHVPVQPEEAKETKEVVVVRERLVHEKVLSNGYRQVSIITDPEIIERVKFDEKS